MPATTTPSGLIIDDVVVGSGEAAAAGQQVSVHYTGWLFFGGGVGGKRRDGGDPGRFQKIAASRSRHDSTDCIATTSGLFFAREPLAPALKQQVCGAPPGSSEGPA